MKKLLAIVMTFAIAFGVCSLAFASEDGFITTVDSVTDVPEGWTAIRTAEDLNNIRNDLAGKYILMNNIDLSVYDNWSPIGDATTPFTGILDGNGYTIENMKITISSESTILAGLFGKASNAQICDVRVENILIDINGSGSLGIGGIVGYTFGGAIYNCVSSGKIVASTEKEGFVGGIVGSNNSEISGCSSHTDINVSCKSYITYVGGITGRSTKKISKSYNSGLVSVSGEGDNATTMAGGISGSNFSADIENCYNIGNVVAESLYYAYAGGIAGESSSITNCYNYSDVITATTEKESDTYISFGAISGVTVFHFESVADNSVQSVYDSYLINCYYLNNISQATGDPIEDAMINVKALTADEMKLQVSYDGFDFENVWVMDEELGRPAFIDENIAESTTENKDSNIEPTTVMDATESITQESTTESTTVTEVETSTILNSTNTSVEETTVTESSTDLMTEKTTSNENVKPSSDCIIIKFLEQLFKFTIELTKQTFDWVEKIVSK